MAGLAAVLALADPAIPEDREGRLPEDRQGRLPEDRADRPLDQAGLEEGVVDFRTQKNGEVILWAPHDTYFHIYAYIHIYTNSLVDSIT